MDSFAASLTGMIFGTFFSVAIGLPEAFCLLAAGGGVAGFMFVKRLKA